MSSSGRFNVTLNYTLNGLFLFLLKTLQCKQACSAKVGLELTLKLAINRPAVAHIQRNMQKLLLKIMLTLKHTNIKLSASLWSIHHCP